MEEMLSRSALFEFTDPRQRWIYEELPELIGPGPAAFFRDACWMMTNPRVLETTTHLVAHCLREVESALRAVLIPIVKGQRSADPVDSHKGQSHKDQIRHILQWLGISEDSREGQAWLELPKVLNRLAHRSALDPPRPIEEMLNVWSSTQDLLAIVLQAIRNKYLNWLPVLEQLLTVKQPTEEDIRRLANEVPNNAIIRGYFFDRLENPEWLEPLREKGFFKHPPGPVRNEEEGTIRFWPWPEAKYLARMAKHRPELVCRIILEMPDTDNIAVLVDLADAALAMPPDVSAQLVEKATTWARAPYSLLSEKLGKLMACWANGGKTGEAIRLARALLEQVHFNVWWCREFLQKHYPELVRAAGIPALEALCDSLEKVIRLSRRQYNDEGPEDYSYIWRPAIEDHPQNPEHIPKGILVAGVRDAAEEVIRSGKATVEEVVEILESRQWKVFHRIALHVLRVFAEQAPDLVAARLTRRDLFGDAGVLHEYALLLRAAFSRLSEQERQMILEWIAEGPDEDDPARYRELWQRDWLARIGFENLPEEWQERYRTLVARYGEPMEKGVGPTSPKTADELRTMSVREIVAFLRTWEPPENVFGEPSPAGLGRTLASVVAENPGRFAAEAECFQDLDPTYVRALLSGLRDGLKQQKVFDWQPVLRLCRWVLDQAREIPGRRVGPLEADLDWGETRKAIARLLSAGFKSEGGEIPIELRGEAWGILRPLTDDPDPTPEQEAPHSGSGMDPATLSINTVRGEAMHAVICYALWVRRQFEKQVGAKKRPARSFDEMPEVREVLDAHLDTSRDPSLAVRAVYGQWFPQLTLLDRAWAEDRKDRIFPTDERSQAYFDAAWNAYIALCRPYDNVFDLLRDIYVHAIRRIGAHNASARWIKDPDESLAEHLMVYYLRGKIELHDQLLDSFWDKATDALRAHAIIFIGQALRQTESAIPAEIITRLQALWDERFSRIREVPQEHEKEIAAFGWWFASGKFDTSWSIDRLLEALRLIPRSDPVDMVVERLAQTVKTHPAKSVQAFRRIAEGDREGWAIYRNREPIRRILEAGVRSPDARQDAEATIHYLGSRGFPEYRDLLS